MPGASTECQYGYLMLLPKLNVGTGTECWYLIVESVVSVLKLTGTDGTCTENQSTRYRRILVPTHL